MKTFIVKNKDGLFLGYLGKWKQEYPEACEFTSLAKAQAAAKKTGVWCEIIEAFGTEDERVVP